MTIQGCIVDPEQDPPKKTGFALGDIRDLGTYEVDDKGATLTANDSDVYIKIIVPPLSYKKKVTFTVHAQKIKENKYGENVTPLTDLITIDCGGEIASKIITIQMPVITPIDSFSMPFFYHSDKNELEGIPIISYDGKVMELATRRMGAFLISAVPTSKLTGDFTSNFLPGRDDWDFPNYGTATTSGGQYLGQTLSSLWYFYEQRPTSSQLWGRFNSKQDKEQKIWYDNVAGILFALSVEGKSDWFKMTDELKKMKLPQNTRSYYSLCYSLLVTKAPQLIELITDEGYRLPIIAYRISDSKVHFSDPNFPGELTRTTLMNDDVYKSYSTGYSLLKTKSGEEKHFHSYVYLGVRALVNWESIDSAWNSRSKSESYMTTLEIKDAFGAITPRIDQETQLLTYFSFSDSILISMPSAGSTILSEYNGSEYIPFNNKKYALSTNSTTIQLFAYQPSVNPVGYLLWSGWSTITVKYEPVQLLSNRDTIPYGDSVKYTVKTAPSQSKKFRYAFELGDGSATVKTDTNIVYYTYKKPDTFKATVTTFDISTNILVGKSTKTISVLPPTIIIHPDTAKGVIDLPAYFIADKVHRKNLHIKYVWDFGDGASPTALTDSSYCTHIYKQNGTYNINLSLYEISTNTLLGSEKSVAIVQNMGSVSLDQLHQMNYIDVIFKGNGYYAVVPEYGAPTLTELYNMSIKTSCGSSDLSSTSRIIWDGLAFSTKSETSKSWSNHDSSSFSGSSGSYSEGTIIKGIFSQSANILSTCYGAYSYKSSSNRYDGPHNINTSETINNSYSLNGQSIYLSSSSSNDDTIVFQIEGAWIESSVTITDGYYNFTTYQRGPPYRRTYGYLYTDWQSTTNPPQFIVRFRRK